MNKGMCIVGTHRYVRSHIPKSVDEGVNLRIDIRLNGNHVVLNIIDIVVKVLNNAIRLVRDLLQRGPNIRRGSLADGTAVRPINTHKG